MHPIKVSEWKLISEANKQLLLSVGAVPYNDIYEPIWHTLAKIILIFGGRGGGKSEITVDELLNECLTENYFKCYYGRKVYDTVRESCFDTLHRGIEKNRLQKYFHYSTANTSSMIITCTNGNKFIPFGSDKADKLKSIKDPTHVWCEEFDQFTFDDFKDIFPTLRTTKGANKFYGTFNTHSIYLNLHWLIKVFFPDIYTGDDKQEFDILKGVEVLKIFANYTDNYFIDQEDYCNRLRLASGGNAAIFEGIANGAWGVMENKNPWLYSFADKHVKPDIAFLPNYPVYLSFDFNNAPFACTAWQHSENLGDPRMSFIHGIKEFSGKLKVDEMCHQIKAYFPNSVLFVTGDRSGNNEDVGRNNTVYELIQSHLGLGKGSMHLNTHNLEHADSRIFMNAMLNDYPNFYISRAGCPNLIRQCQAAEVDIKSTKPQQLKKDREGFKNDEFDSFRYYMQTYFHAYAKKKFFRIMK